MLQQQTQKAMLTRYNENQKQGHYESFFIRGNHPNKPLAFWFRYTIFSPKDNPQNAIAEIWGIFFDSEKNNHTLIKNEVPLHQCYFNKEKLDVKITNSSLDENKLYGNIRNIIEKTSLQWDLRYSGDQPPLFDLPLNLYNGAFPKAKALVGLPLARFDGSIKVNNKKVNIKNWIGSVNHNWGTKHTDLYAWGQVAGFDNAPNSFLELATAKLKMGPLWTPFLTPIVLRHNNKEYQLNKLSKVFRRATFKYFEWKFEAKSKEVILKGKIQATKKDFICLRYYNPPGGEKYCLNSKLAHCELQVHDLQTNRKDKLIAMNRAAFEILTDKKDHGFHFQA